MQQKRQVFYFDYSPETFDYIMASRILRQSEKDILKDIIAGKTAKEIAIERKCSYRTICTKRKIIFEKTLAYM